MDAASALTDSLDPGAYWRKLKQRLSEESSEVVTFCHGLKLVAPDGKMRETDCANTEGLLRIIQSIPSPKAEPFKRWLARVGYERVQEIDDPELVMKRMRAIYKAQGYLDYCQAYINFHLHNTPVWWIGAEAVENRLKSHLRDLENVDEIIATLAESDYEHETVQEENDLISIAEQLKRLKLTTADRKKWPEPIEQQFQKHIGDYSSIPFGYTNYVTWDEPHFLERLDKILFSFDEEKSRRETRQHKKRQAKQKLLKVAKLSPEALKLLQILGQLSYLQDIKKAAQTRSHPLLQTVVKPEIARRLGLKRDDLNQMTEKEIVDCLRTGNVSDRLQEELALRQGDCVLIMSDFNYTWLYGNEAREYIRINGIAEEIDDNQEIKGTVASKGKVRGKAKVCLSPLEAKKVEHGDVLAAAMTTPDFVPAMKRAAAVVTDEGGLTCHAAILARELAIPCIIGTKVATKVLKDDDLVEVDANLGVVKKVSK